MAIRPVLTREDPILSKKCHPITTFDQKVCDLLDDLRDSLDEAKGLGLAAPQIGILRRVAIVVDDTEEIIELVNPQIIAQSDELVDGMEGCLSVPGLYGAVERPQWVRVRAQDREGNFFEVVGEDMTARCFCHELAHLDGQLYTALCDELYTPEELEAMEDED